VAWTFPEDQDKPKNQKEPISFSKDVYPILRKRCMPCHASDSDNPSNLFMDSYEDIMKGGKHGSPIIPGKGEESIIIKKLHPDPPFGKQMPTLSKTKLTETAIDTIQLWIDQGAKNN
jgi:Planctomycete cytochrome C